LKKIPVYNLQTISCKPSKIGNIEFLRFEDHLKNIKNVHFPHRHDFYYILYISSGSGSHTIDFKKYPVKSGRLFFMSPGQIHEWDLKPDAKGYTLFFNKELFLEDALKIEEQWPFFHSLFYNAAFNLKPDNKSEIENWFKWIFKEYLNIGKYQDDIIKNLLSAFLFKLNSILDLPDKLNQNSKGNILRSYELLIDRHFARQQHLAFYAGQLHISPNYLNAVCKNTLAKSAKLLLNERILLEAKRLLRHSDLNVNGISEYLNFTTSSYFIRFFRKMEGCTPLDFKQLK